MMIVAVGGEGWRRKWQQQGKKNHEEEREGGGGSVGDGGERWLWSC